jgi:acylphosphatase
MNKCLRIALTAHASNDFLYSFIQKHARKLGLEGMAQKIDPKNNQIRITVCGDAVDLDNFIDLIHKAIAQFDGHDMEVEPFLKDKDYRSVFRIID